MMLSNNSGGSIIDDDIFCDEFEPSTTCTYIFSVVLSLIALIACIGNLLTIIVVILDPLKCLRSPFTSFVVNLSIADALQGAIAVPFVVYHLLDHEKGLRLTSKTVHCLTCISLLSVFFSTVIISVDRYIGITRPLKYRVHLSHGRCLKIASAIWVISIGSGFLITYRPYETISFMVYNYFMLVTGIIVMFITFVLMYRFLKQNERQFCEKLRSASITSTSSRYNAEKRVTIVLLIVLSIFMGTYIPALVMLNLSQYCFECSCETRYDLYVIRYILLVSNSAINPFVYSIRMKDFRNSIQSLFVRKTNRKTRYRLITDTSSDGVSNLEKSAAM
ncbi:histamine H2 receptor-like [Clytia hemisphaerica]|uniref:G-protein coupled receptors family 1 profile domain-containing protein n=1 Tax=Clytia hemisphaerica TaxID=252671 RepID=A0A7M5V759_9CNID